MLNQKSVLARLLANENITVQQGNFETAYFDVKTRVLGLPLWKDMGKDVYDMLVGHEVSHALFTPENFHEYMNEGIPHSWLNIVEDVRIEKLILRKYPGLVGNFKRGYIHLMQELDLFGVKDKLDQLHTLPFMDRLNLHAKARDLLDVPFADDELPFVAQAKACETYEDVVQCCRDIQAWLGEKAQDQQGDVDENQQGNGETITIDMPGQPSTEDTDDQEDTEGDTQGEGQPGEEEGDEGQSTEQSSDGEKTEEESDTNSDTSEGEEEGDNDQSNSEKGAPATPESGLMDEEAATDVNFNQNASAMLNDNGTVFAQGLTKAEADACTVPYAEIAKGRHKALQDRRKVYDSFGDRVSMSDLAFPEAEYAEFLRETKQVVNLMVKEFEMRKAAYRSARARTSTRGTLDVNKLHRFKYDDHLFKQVSRLADAKNHGMMMLIDYSGSMASSLPAVQRQLLALMMFCKRVSIPFEVYAFTSLGSSDYWTEVKKAKETAKPIVTHIDSEDLALLEMFSSSMSKRDYEEAFKMVFWQSAKGGYRSPVSSVLEELGNTPLNTALMAMQYKIKAFRAKYAVEKMNFVTLTDGDSNSLWVRSGVDVQDRYLRGHRIMVDVDGKKVEMPARSGYGRDALKVTAALIKSIEQMGCSTSNYFIAWDNRDLNGCLRQALTVNGWNDDYRPQFNKLKRDVRNNGVAIIDDNLGYQRRFILTQNANMQGEIEDLDVDSGMSAKKIAKAFGKSNGSKKKSRVVTQKFAELIA